MEIVRYTDPVAYAERVRPLLVTREPESCLLLGIIGGLERVELGRRNDPAAQGATDSMTAAGAPPLLWSIERNGACLGAALRTPPHNVVVSRLAAEAATALVEHLVTGEYEVPGFHAPKETTAVLAARYAARTGARVELDRAERIYALERVRRDWLPAGARPPAGSARLARDSEVPLLQDWFVAFQEELALPHRPPADAATQAHARRQLWVWEREGRPVSLVRWSGRTPNGVRIGPVYTPPEARGHGYASGCVEAVCRDRLAAGRRWCFLFTDLANPTSNHIYQEIGFEPVCDVDEVRVVDDDGR